MIVCNESRNEVYLCLLAGRAVSGLADLAEDLNIPAGQAAEDLRSGIEFCRLVRVPTLSQSDEGDLEGAMLEVKKLMHRLVSQAESGGTAVSCDELNFVETYLNDLISGSRKPSTDALLRSMNFFLKATSGRTLKVQEDGALF